MLPGVDLKSGYRIPRLIRGTWQLHEAARSLDREAALAEIGGTNFPADPMAALLDAGVPVISNQVQLSLLDPRAQTHVLPLCRARNVSLLGYGPLAGGFLSARWRGQPDPGLESGSDR